MWGSSATHIFSCLGPAWHTTKQHAKLMLTIPNPCWIYYNSFSDLHCTMRGSYAWGQHDAQPNSMQNPGILHIQSAHNETGEWCAGEGQGTQIRHQPCNTASPGLNAWHATIKLVPCWQLKWNPRCSCTWSPTALTTATIKPLFEPCTFFWHSWPFWHCCKTGMAWSLKKTNTTWNSQKAG